MYSVVQYTMVVVVRLYPIAAGIIDLIRRRGSVIAVVAVSLSHPLAVVLRILRQVRSITFPTAIPHDPLRCPHAPRSSRNSLLVIPPSFHRSI